MSIKSFDSILKELSSKMNDEQFLDLLYKSYYSLDETSRKRFFKYCLENGYFSKYKMNFISTYYLIKTLGLKHCETHHSSRYKFDRHFTSEKKNTFRFSIPSMYGDYAFHCRLDKTTDYSWIISPKSSIVSRGINLIKTDTLIDPSKLVVIDIETTGLNPITDDITEIGLLDLGTNKKFSKLLPLIKKESIPKNIVELTSISDEMVSGASDLSSEDLDDLINEFDLENKTILIWTSNNMFDAVFLANYFFDRGNIRFPNLKFVSGIEIIKDFAKKNNIYTFSKDYVAQRLGVSNDGSHRALADCEIEANIYREVYKRSIRGL